ncbi:shikimate dehydrogenase [Candidatus Njordibacter sp. Uisw_039]|jgi:shikimate dehydrogenase|uniref:shikimate dehydrogenase n=1 Tax=Candidatus Njordibacter sp. Uisw_039 TaxID=3230972 RepID=UPI003A4A0263|tara:strand:- start:21770 stop:22603 length:834 start_codon:yes stop_codon:yes gene_type:complete
MSIDQYRVFGNPIHQSKSPNIHKAFAEATKQHINYQAQLVLEAVFEHTVKEFFATGGKGLNITVPFKQRAFAMAQAISPAAEKAEAANTLYLNEQGQLVAENTDGVGLVRDICHNLNGELKAKRILVLGAGGAVRGVLQPLLAQLPKQLIIANRTHSKAQTLAASFADLGSIDALPMGQLKGQFDWVINGTSASLAGDLPPLPDGLLTNNTHCYDMMYSAKTTVFNTWAVKQGVAQANDGLGMLVEQAAQSFKLWRGLLPPTAEVLLALRSELRKEI